MKCLLLMETARTVVRILEIHCIIFSLSYMSIIVSCIS